MVHFDKAWFGSIMADGRVFKDVMVVDGRLIDRENLVRGFFDNNIHTHHSVYEHELKLLLEGSPEVIIIGDGHSDVLEVPIKVAEAIKKRGIGLFVMSTPKALDEFNRMSKTKRVNALMHSTC